MLIGSNPSHIHVSCKKHNCILSNVYIFPEYSVGAIYLIIQNLPRSMRYKRENVILIGLMPGPKEPQVTMNSFLQPLVQELNEIWTGVVISCPSHPLKNIYIRAALTCCACDIPATRKLCGFVGHNAKMGCSKCCKEFPPLRSGDGIHNQKRDFIGHIGPYVV